MKRLLLIDDDRDDAELFMEAVTSIDPAISVQFQDDPAKALDQLLHAGPDLPDLIFLDINMPIISGWQCLVELKKTEPLKRVPVLLFTTSSQAREKEMAREMGASGFITKPNEYKLLCHLLSRIIKKEMNEHTWVSNDDAGPHEA